MNLSYTFSTSKLIDDWQDDINFLSLDAKTLKIFENYVEIHRQIIELDNLLYVFYFNVINMRKCHTFYTSDQVTPLVCYPDVISNYHSINALTTNCISSGKTLVEALENVAKIWGNDFLKKIKEFTSSIYDSSFPYRFLIHHRNYAQHGHLPVTEHNGKFCFNLNDILNTPHFNFHEPSQQQMKNMIDEINVKFNDEPNIAYTLTIASFIVDVLKIYCFTMTELMKFFSERSAETTNVINENPEFITTIRDSNKQVVFYKIEDRHAHCFFLSEDEIRLIKEHTQVAERILDEEKELLSKIESQYSFNSTIDCF